MNGIRKQSKPGGVPEAPRGMARLLWLGPGLIWMVSAAGSGELLFTPRIGAFYGYALIWALVLAIVMKWFINRELGRFAVCSGRPILSGIAALPRLGRPLLYLLLVPQLLVATATIAGLASGAATAALLVAPGSVQFWTLLLIGVALLLVLFGGYGVVEKVSSALGITLALVAVTTAVSVQPPAGDLAAGLVPSFPPNARIGEILPWLGFALSGAAGMIWYSYWLPAKGYGAAGREGREEFDPKDLPHEDRERLRGWLGQLTLDNSVAVVGTLLIMGGFLVLGTELLRPEGLVPEEDRIAGTLGNLLGNVWGPLGFWFMVAGVFIGFWTTVLSDQDGFARMFADGTRAIIRPLKPRGLLDSEVFWRRAYLIVLLALVPAGLYLLVGEPVSLLQMAGAIEATQLPLLAGATLYLNNRSLPEELKPTRFSFVMTVAAAAFFLAFALLYLLQLLGVNPLGGAS